MENQKAPRPTTEKYREFRELKKQSKTLNREDRIHSLIFDMISEYDMSTEVFQSGEKWGLKNPIGEVILQPLYDNFMRLTSQDLDTDDLVVAELNDKWGVLRIDGEGSWVIEPEYDYIGYPNPITHVRKGDKWGVIKVPEGDFLIPLDCDSIDDWNGFMFANGISFYHRGGKTGVIAEWGQFTDAIFEEIDFDPDLYVKVLYEGKWGYIDSNNQFTEDEDEAAIYPTDL